MTTTRRGLRLARSPLPAAVCLLLSVVCLLPSVGRAAALAEREVLPSGMTLLVSEKRVVPIVTGRMLIPAGSLLDPPDQPGLANLTAELLMQGTTTRTATEISEAIEFVGGSLGVEASHEVVQVSFSVLRKDLDLVLELVADVLLRPTFPPEEVARKAQEVVAGIRRKLEDPGAVADEVFATLVFGDQTYGRPVEGTEASVPKLTREDLLRFHERHYRPDRAILAVVGDVGLGELRQRLTARLSPWRPGAPEFPIARPPQPLDKPRLRLIPREISQANVVLGHLGVRRDHPDYYAIQVMNYILGGGGLTSRLTASIREAKGWAYDVSSAFIPSKYAGSFSVTLQTKNETAQEAVEAALAEVRRIRDQPVSETELADAKAYLTGSFPLRLDTNGKIARLLASIEYHGLGLDYVERYTAHINGVTIADVQRVARTYLHPDQYALAVVGDLAKAKIRER